MAKDTVLDKFKRGLSRTGADIKAAITPSQQPPANTAARNNKLRSKVRGALPRPPLNVKDMADIASGQNASVIRKRREAINRGIKIRTRHGGQP
jgi:hypothetical protein